MHFRSSTRALMATPPPEKGFVLPVVLGVGVIIILLGVMMIERSSQNRIAAIAQKANVRSSAAAEHGITALQALFKRYPPLAIYCSSERPKADKSASPFCSTTPSSLNILTGNNLPLWLNISKDALDKIDDSCSTNSTELKIIIQSYANQQWRSISDNLADGQFRLVSYQYYPNTKNPAIGTGSLTVEGRINPDDAIRTATTQLKVNFNITHDLGLGAPPLPGLWIQENQTAGASSSVKLLTNVRDSTCPSDAASFNPVQQLKAQTQSPFIYQPTPGITFPELPLEGVDLASTTAAVNSASEATQIEAIESPAISLPSPTQPQLGSNTTTDTSVLTYRVKANKNGQSIHLTNSSDVLKIGTDSETVVLNLEGGLTITGGGKIQLAPNKRLIIYAHGPVTLSGEEKTAAIEQVEDPLEKAKPLSARRVQLYVYPSNSVPAPAVSLSGEAVPLYLVLVAPASVVTSSARVQGSIWAKSWQGEGSAAVVQDLLNASDLKLLWPPRISPITTWQRGDS
jgi:Tfp pilus assembly protein PilX